ncbi:hypothetical protein SAMN05216525_15222 [Bradyrhizobium sp. Gha]|nr:hypothetical protein SAMN05216525_15222 [Bradyrhizobium sp. Gha]
MVGGTLHAEIWFGRCGAPLSSKVRICAEHCYGRVFDSRVCPLALAKDLDSSVIFALADPEAFRARKVYGERGSAGRLSTLFKAALKTTGSALRATFNDDVTRRPSRGPWKALSLSLTPLSSLASVTVLQRCHLTPLGGCSRMLCLLTPRGPQGTCQIWVVEMVQTTIILSTSAPGPRTIAGFEARSRAIG